MSSKSLPLAERAMRESLRAPEALLPTLFIPLFFLVVNVGQASNLFPSESTPFLFGQSYAAFQLPSSILLAASFGGAALFLVEDIEGGYFDKLRAAPVSRTSLIMGRLSAEAARTVLLTLMMIGISMLFFDVSIASGPLGLVLLLLMAGAWALVAVAEWLAAQAARRQALVSAMPLAGGGGVVADDPSWFAPPLERSLVPASSPPEADVEDVEHGAGPGVRLPPRTDD